MSAMTLFDQAYKLAYARGHVVCCAAVGMRQLGFHAGPTPADAHASFRFAEQIVDAADEFHDALKPGFRDSFKTDMGDTLIYADTSCRLCGHPYCDLYLTAGLLPSRKPMTIPVILVQQIKLKE